MAEHHLGSPVAWARVVGSVMSRVSWVVNVSFWIGLQMLFLDQVVIE